MGPCSFSAPLLFRGGGWEVVEVNIRSSDMFSFSDMYQKIVPRKYYGVLGPWHITVSCFTPKQT